MRNRQFDKIASVHSSTYLAFLNFFETVYHPH